MAYMSGPRGPQQGAEQLRQAEEEELGQVRQVGQVCCCVSLGVTLAGE